MHSHDLYQNFPELSKINKTRSVIKKINGCKKKFYAVTSLHLCVNYASRYIEGKGKNKCLFFANSDDENKELLKKYTDVCDEIKNKITAINDCRIK